MRIGGVQRLTLVDFPGKVAAIVFTQGCNFRCGFCHNPHLVLPEQFQTSLSPQEVLNYFERRRHQLQGIVISGGEPTLQKDLVDFIVKLKHIGFAVKLDTNGSNPEVLAPLIDLKLIDYIAMDIKTSMSRYHEAAGISVEIKKIEQSIDLIIHSGLPHQFRTTLVKSLCLSDDLKAIQQRLEHAAHYVIQPFIPSPQILTVDLLREEQYTNQEILKVRQEFEK